MSSLLWSLEDINGKSVYTWLRECTYPSTIDKIMLMSTQIWKAPDVVGLAGSIPELLKIKSSSSCLIGWQSLTITFVAISERQDYLLK